MNILLPIIAELHAPAMRPRHWQNVAKICGVPKIDVGSSTFTLSDISSLEIENYEDAVLDVVETAMKELKIDRKLKLIESVWDELELGFKQHKESDISLIYVTEEVIEELEAHQMELQTMIGMGKYVAFFRDEVTGWQKTLGNVDVCMKKWTSVIKQWAGLESIFLGSADIRAQLPDDTKRFEGIDQEFKDLQKSAEAETNVAKACNVDGRIESLGNMLSELELCQKALNEYLDMKKKIYPRFYFISDPVLLQILSQASDPEALQSFYQNFFDSIDRVVHTNPRKIVAVQSICGSERETIQMLRHVNAVGNIEEWFSQGRLVSPLTNLPLSSDLLFPNLYLKKLINELN